MRRRLTKVDQKNLVGQLLGASRVLLRACSSGHFLLSSRQNECIRDSVPSERSRLPEGYTKTACGNFDESIEAIGEEEKIFKQGV